MGSGLSFFVRKLFIKVFIMVGVIFFTFITYLVRVDMFRMVSKGVVLGRLV